MLMSYHQRSMVALLLIGDEILSGQVQEVNLAEMITQLNTIGQRIGEVRIVGDDRLAIAAAFAALQPRYDYLLSAGGIGPTHDDLTLEAAAEGFGVAVELHPEMETFLRTRYETPLAPMVRRMALMPRGTVIHRAPNEHWPLIQWQNVFILPGLPRALRHKMRSVVEMLPRLQPRHAAELHLTVDESLFADWLGELQSRYPAVAIGSYPIVDEGAPRVRLSFGSTDPSLLQAARTEVAYYCRTRGWLLDPAVTTGET